MAIGIDIDIDGEERRTDLNICHCPIQCRMSQGELNVKEKCHQRRFFILTREREKWTGASIDSIRSVDLLHGEEFPLPFVLFSSLLSTNSPVESFSSSFFVQSKGTHAGTFSWTRLIASPSSSSDDQHQRSGSLSRLTVIGHSHGEGRGLSSSPLLAHPVGEKLVLVKFFRYWKGFDKARSPSLVILIAQCFPWALGSERGRGDTMILHLSTLIAMGIAMKTSVHSAHHIGENAPGWGECLATDKQCSSGVGPVDRAAPMQVEISLPCSSDLHAV